MIRKSVSFIPCPEEGYLSDPNTQTSSCVHGISTESSTAHVLQQNTETVTERIKVSSGGTGLFEYLRAKAREELEVCRVQRTVKMLDKDINMNILDE